MAGIHGLRIGQDLRNPVLAASLGIILALALGVFFFKRFHKPVAPKPTK
jgi:hypothetical protein